MAPAPLIKPPLAVFFGNRPLIRKAFQQFQLGRIGRLVAGAGIDNFGPACRLQRDRYATRGARKFLPPNRPRLIAKLQNVRDGPIA